MYYITLPYTITYYNMKVAVERLSKPQGSQRSWKPLHIWAETAEDLVGDAAERRKRN